MLEYRKTSHLFGLALAAAQLGHSQALKVALDAILEMTHRPADPDDLPYHDDGLERKFREDLWADLWFRVDHQDLTYDLWVMATQHVLSKVYAGGSWCGRPESGGYQMTLAAVKAAGSILPVQVREVYNRAGHEGFPQFGELFGLHVDQNGLEPSLV